MKFNSNDQAIFYEIASRLWLIYTGWMAFFVFSVVHCNFVNWSVSGFQFNLFSSCGYIALNWGFWLIATPLLLFFLSITHVKNIAWVFRSLALLGLTVTVIAVRVSYDVLMGPGEWVSSIVYFSPGYLKAMLAILAMWQIFYRQERYGAPESVVANSASKPSNIKLENRVSIPEAIWIDKGTSRIRVSVPNILAVRSAGNYVEVVTTSETSMTRGSLNNFLANLDDPDLVRVHRSVAVRRSKIKEIKSLKAGNGIIHMEQGFSFPVSKTYLKFLKT